MRYRASWPVRMYLSNRKWKLPPNMFQNCRQWTPLEKHARMAAERRLTTSALGISAADSAILSTDLSPSSEFVNNKRIEIKNLPSRSLSYENYNFDCEYDNLLYIRGWISSGELPNLFEIGQLRYIIISARKTFRPDVNVHLGMGSSDIRLGFDAVVKVAAGKSRSGLFFQEKSMKMGTTTSIPFTVKAIFIKQAPRGAIGHVDLMKKVTKFSVFN
jgi:hypothetical protein